MIRSKLKNAMEGKYTGGFIKFGYYIDEKTKLYKEHPENGAIVRQIFEMYSSGKISGMSISKELSKKAINVSPNFVNNILRTPEYAGEARQSYKYMYKKHNKAVEKTVYARTYPALISIELFEKCRAVALKNNVSVVKAKHTYFGAKIIKCACCGSAFTGHFKKKMYRCESKYNNPAKFFCTETTLLNVNVMDSILWFLAQRKETDFIINQSDKKIEEYKGMIAELQSMIDMSDKRYEDLLCKKMKDLRKNIPSSAMDDKKLKDLAEMSIKNEVSQINQDVKKWNEEKNRLNNLINEIDINQSVFNFNSIDEVMPVLERGEIISRQLNEITDDKIIYDIVHKHIREVNVTKVDDIFNPSEQTKQITVKYFDNVDDDVFYYDGKGLISEKHIYQIEHINNKAYRMHTDIVIKRRF
jgi:hypothetical protein